MGTSHVVVLEELVEVLLDLLAERLVQPVEEFKKGGLTRKRCASALDLLAAPKDVDRVPDQSSYGST
jgi:hypothetical protein